MPAQGPCEDYLVVEPWWWPTNLRRGRKFLIASRLWYIVLSLVIGFLTFLLYVASSHFDRASRARHARGPERRRAGGVLVPAGRRAAALEAPHWYRLALDPELASALGESSGTPDKPPADVRDKVKKMLKTVDDKLPADLKFTALFAIDQYGRVVAQLGFDQALGIEDFELGGYPVVADALHGWIRDDTWVLDGRIYRVVARPVEGDTSQPPPAPSWAPASSTTSSPKS